MGVLPPYTYPATIPAANLGKYAQPYPPAQKPAPNTAPSPKTPAASLAGATGANAAAASGFAMIQTGGDGEEKAVPLTDLLVDPITRKQFDLDTPFTDRLLKLTPAQKVKQSLHHTFVTLPKTIVQGLRGDNRFTFSDYLDVSNIPYYLGGAVLAGSFAAGGDRFNFLRQGIGVGLYYLGVMASNAGINEFFKLRSGVDLNQKYRKPNGDIEKVFASVDFPRLDLLTEADYERLAHKMGVPNNVADPKREVNEQTRQIISTARADKLILGNLVAAIGAGYIARSELWGRLLDSNSPIKSIWNYNDAQQGNLINRLSKTNAFLWGKTQPALQETLKGGVNEARPWLRKSLIGGLGAGTGLILWHSWATMNRSQRAYESPFLTNLSPELAPELSPVTAAIQRNLPGGEIQRLNRQSIFATVRNVEARSLWAATNQPDLTDHDAPGALKNESKGAFQ